MIARLACAAFCCALAASAFARDLTPDQQRMRACNTQAKQKQLEGPERNHFMTSCLNGNGGNGRRLTLKQRRHEECNAQAHGMEGAARRGYMTECEKSDHAKQTTAEREKMKNCHRRAADRRIDGDEYRDYVKGCMNGSAATGS